VESDLDSTRTLAMVSNVGFVVAALGGGLVLTSFLLEPAADKAQGKRTPRRASAVIGVGYAGLRGTF
jgi:hypothetical protein